MGGLDRDGLNLCEGAGEGTAALAKSSCQDGEAIGVPPGWAGGIKDSTT